MLNLEMEMTSQEMEDYLTQVMDEIWGKETQSPQSKNQAKNSKAQPSTGSQES